MTYAIVAVIVLILDQAMKYWTTANIPLGAIGSQCVKLVPGVLQLTDVHNFGAAFNILQNARWLLVGVTVVFAVAVVVLMSREVIATRFGRWTAVLVLAGALGNGIDRALYGYVVDMFEFTFMSFPVFNIADVFITVCGILFCIHVIFHKETEEELAAKKAAPKPGRDEYVPDYDEQAPVARRRRTPETPYDRVPKRGEHRREPVKPADEKDPFAEWEIGSAAEPAAPKGRKYAEPEDDYGFDEPEDDEEQDVQQALPFMAKPVVKPAAPVKPAPAPVKPAPVKPAPAPAVPAADDDFSDFNLDDILAEFGDD